MLITFIYSKVESRTCTLFLDITFNNDKFKYLFKFYKNTRTHTELLMSVQNQKYVEQQIFYLLKNI